jgi:hypothetical protein
VVFAAEADPKKQKGEGCLMIAPLQLGNKIFFVMKSGQSIPIVP